MRTRDAMIATALALACAIAPGTSGCIHNPAPEDRGPTEAATDGHGGTIIIRMRDKFPIGGELIAVDAHNVYVLIGSALVAVPRERIDSADVFAYQSNTGTTATWGGLMTLTTVSHGFFAVFSMPIWMISTIWTTAAESRAPRYQYPDGPLEDFVPWARFPQGLPVGMTGRLLVWDSRPRPDGIGEVDGGAAPAVAPPPAPDARPSAPDAQPSAPDAQPSAPDAQPSAPGAAP